MTIPYAELERLWISAGGPPAQAPVAAAIAMAESSGNPGAVNPVDDGGLQSSFGLWQISAGTHVPPGPNWMNPLVNAQMAVAKYQGAGDNFTPWGTYDSGIYRGYLRYSSPPPPPSPDPSPSPRPTGRYPRPPGYYDNLITNVMRHSDVVSMRRAMDAWQQFGSALHDVLRPAGSPGNANPGRAAPCLSLADVTAAYLAGWQGEAARHVLNQAELVRDFGNRVGLMMYDRSEGGDTLHRALSVVRTALIEINVRYTEYKRAYRQWAAELAKVLAAYTQVGAGHSGAVRRLPTEWADTTVQTYIAAISKPNCTVCFTICDQTERHTVQVSGAVASPGGLVVFRADAAPGDVERQLIETFTVRYKDRVGPLADLITSDSGGYRAAARMLPTGRPPGQASAHGRAAPIGYARTRRADVNSGDRVLVPKSVGDPGPPGVGAGIGPVVLGGAGAGGMVARPRMSVADRAGWDIGDVPIPPVISNEFCCEYRPAPGAEDSQ